MFKVTAVVRTRTEFTWKKDCPLCDKERQIFMDELGKMEGSHRGVYMLGLREEGYSGSRRSQLA